MLPTPYSNGECSLAMDGMSLKTDTHEDSLASRPSSEPLTNPVSTGESIAKRKASMWRMLSARLLSLDSCSRESLEVQHTSC